MRNANGKWSVSSSPDSICFSSQYLSKFSAASGNKWSKPTDRNRPPENAAEKARRTFRFILAILLYFI